MTQPSGRLLFHKGKRVTSDAVVESRGKLHFDRHLLPSAPRGHCDEFSHGWTSARDQSAVSQPTGEVSSGLPVVVFSNQWPSHRMASQSLLTFVRLSSSSTGGSIWSGCSSRVFSWETRLQSRAVPPRILRGRERLIVVTKLGKTTYGSHCETVSQYIDPS